MATDFNLTEGLIRQRSARDSFERGQQYYLAAAVHSLVRRGGKIEAEVEGSRPRPYHVHISFDAGGVAGAACTFSYDGPRWCKHVVAVLLTCLHEPSAVEEREPLEARLAGLTAEQAREVLLRIAGLDSSLADALERQLDLLSNGVPQDAKAGTKRRRAVNGSSIRRAVHDVLHSLDRMRASEAYWQVGAVVDGVREILAQTHERLDAGDGDGALAILEAVTEAYLADWKRLDDSDGEASAFFEDLANTWMEALLSLDLTAPEGTAWAAKLQSWADDLDEDYGLGEALYAAASAASERWDNPALKAVLQGNVTNDAKALAALAAEPPDLTVARLNVLERQERFEEYLRLAGVMGQAEAVASMLARLGRLKEAVEFGREHLQTADAALRLAQRLRDKGALKEALEVAEYGTRLSGRKAELAAWLCDLARGAGRADLALRAAVLAFRERPDLGLYLSARELAGTGWDSLRDELLSGLRATKAPLPADAVEVFLYEGLIEDAMAAVKASGDYRLIERVAEAAIETDPDWVIETCRSQAEAIMDPGKADLYGTAVRWLGYVREAYRVAAREQGWQVYLHELTVRHARKYKLRPMLEALRR